MPESSTPAQYPLILIDMVESWGCERTQLLAGTSLADSGIAGIGARISDRDFSRLVNNALALTADPTLGLKLGLRLNLSAHAVLGQAFMTCRDLAQVLHLFQTYYHLLAPALELEFDTVGDRWILTTLSSNTGVPLQFSYELIYAAIVNTLQALLDSQPIEPRIELPYPRPGHADAYAAVLGNDIHFDCVRGRISFALELLDTPLPSSNPALRSLYEAECARLLANLGETSSTAERTLRLLRKFEGQYPQMPRLAEMLNLTPRTYRRRLEEEGCAFQTLLDQVRAEHATRYLQNTRLPLSSIAYMVGFNDSSNFRRAYQKWTGRSPRQVRHEG